MRSAVFQRPRALSAALAVALLATLAAGITVAARGGGGIAGVGRADDPVVADRTYLVSLQPIAAQVHAAVGPAVHVLAQINEPHAGDAFAARDALAHGEALARMRVVHAKLGRLKPPGELSSQHHKMVAAVRKMITALVRLHGFAGLTNGSRLITKFNIVGQGRFEGALQDWDDALAAAYRVRNLHEPGSLTRTLPHSPRSRTGWIFGADRSCSAATYKLVNVEKYRDVPTVSAVESFDGIWQRTLAFVGHRITKLPHPRGAAALPTQLRSRLRLFAYDSRLFGRQLDGLRRESLSSVSRSQEQIHEVLPSLRALSSALRSYGAVSCGLIVGVWSGKHLPSSHKPSAIKT